MKKMITTIGCLAIAASLGVAQTTTADTQNNIGAAGAGSSAPGHNPAFAPSGGSGHGVGVNGGTHTGSVVGTPVNSRGAQHMISTRRGTNFIVEPSGARVQQNAPRSNFVRPAPPPSSP